MKGKMMDSRKHRAIIYCLRACVCVCVSGFRYVCNNVRKCMMTVGFV